MKIHPKHPIINETDEPEKEMLTKKDKKRKVFGEVLTHKPKGTNINPVKEHKQIIFS